MSHEEWEALCDGCGFCCLNKLEDSDTGDYYYTNVACSLFDHDRRRCMAYEKRSFFKHDCMKLTAENIDEAQWLPSSCAYRLIHEGKDLPWWHPLLTGTSRSLEEAGIIFREQLVSEEDIDIETLPDYLIDWISV